MSATSTKVKVKCISKKECHTYNTDGTKQTEIEMHVGYDQKNVYFQQSGGTGMKLMTINQEAADMFELGKDYDIIISPCESE